MTQHPFPDPDLAWAAFSRRDRSYDGRFVGAVTSTGIYCKPSCPARHPLRENVVFYADPASARAAGFRACLRCRPDEVGRDRIAVDKAVGLIAAAGERLSLDALAAAVGYAPHHFHRLFKRDTGVTPAAYARALRAGRAERALDEEESVTEAIYAAGYSGPSRFYAETAKRIGMTPSAWRDGGRGVTIRWAVADTLLGRMLLAATDKGICRLSFDEDEAALARRFPNASIVRDADGLDALLAGAVAAVAQPARAHDLPIDVSGTAFQEAVWRELGRIPPGETLSYAALAARAGRPGAARAAGTACGANQVAVLIPCHRARRGDGTLGGYAYGLPRKVTLLEREAKG
ncbi:MAG: 6-O-methylguanine DNA methyltransferase [Sphingomonas sp. SCN 67-18]|uniref:bifunctional transcriptional activator/DNA repair enzyme AdaA n=1 Tax=uncultured Sphingomonas sp. TaxID=158754 RepID=UPI00086B8756|nr:methylated-DNA--[protein]-cysteine S-methyltransferase [Sphingomonas sp. SCN 67-18]ODU18953.1 MAG: 6-O-methylguanine DNA methyltransferase [Sphingomonas sp. SCN 67-18]